MEGPPPSRLPTELRAGTGGNEPPHKPARSFSEGRTGKIVWHRQREVSHTPARWQPRRRWIEKAAPRLHGLKVPHAEDITQLQMEGEASSLPPAGDVKGLLW